MFGWFRKKVPERTSEEEHLPVVEDFSNVEPLLGYFKEETGIDFDAKKEIITSKLVRFCRDRELYSFSRCLAALKEREALKQGLIDYLTVNETYFYREIAQIREVVEIVQHSAGRVEILCAPSSTGEEPYTIVMLLLEAGVSPERFHIFGIDINSEAIEKAQKAIYRERSLHRLPPPMAERYFIKTEDRYQLRETVTRCVSFRRMNIFEPAFSELGMFDIVFSRNMLIYFDRETKLEAKQRLEGRLRDNTSRIFFGHADLGGTGLYETT